MARQGNKLSALTVNKLAKKVGAHNDGLGLYLEVRRPGDASWTFRYKVGGSQLSRYLGLGPLHTVNLAEARERARQARQCLLDGRDPIEVRRETERQQKLDAAKTLTFADAAERFLSTKKISDLKNEKHRKQWRSTLESYAFPVLGEMPLASIGTADVLRAIQPVWDRTPETGNRVRSRIERIFAWATPLGYFAGENPASRAILKDHLPVKPRAKHHPAMPYASLPAFMASLRDRDSMSAKALEFTILTAVRTSETIGARWEEIDLDAGVWTIPAARMKAKRDHRVPLSPRAVEILRNLEHAKSGHGRVFINSGGKPLSNMAMLELLRGMAGNGYTVHGFRSTFSDWCRDRTNYARDVIEMALAHTIKDKTEAAYRRGDALDKRRRVMGEWARYCLDDRGAVADNVTPLRA